MKPLLLVLQAFGPYKGREEIDFTRLGREDGRFLIYGETGSGKTMILDGITYALYGGEKGDARADLTALRSNRVDREGEKVDTIVAFTFELNGITYKFERKLVAKRVNLSPSHNVYRLDSEGVFQPLLENPRERDVTAKAVELLGLKRDQFRQVIILPQGRFERFLVSGSEEKQAILTSIFGVEKWQRYAQAYFDRAKAKKDGYDEIKLRMNNLLITEGQPDTETFARAIEEGREELARLEKDYAQADYPAQRKALEAEKQAADLWAGYESQQRRQTALLGQAPAMEAARKKLDRATQAEVVRPLLDQKTALSREAESLSRQLSRLEQESLPQAQARAGNAAKALEAHRECLPQKEQWKKNVYTLENKRQVYADTVKAEQAAKSAQVERLKAEEAEEQANEAWGQAKAALAEAVLRLNRERELTHDYEDRYILGIAGELAAALTEGSPCPVCGSTHHPAKAAPERGAVTKAQRDSQRKKFRQAQADCDRLTEETQKQGLSVEECRRLSALARQNRESCGEKLTALKAQLVPDIANTAQLERAIQRLAKQVKDYEDTETRLTGDRDTAQQLADKLAGQRESLSEALSEKRNALAAAAVDLSAALREQGFAEEGEVTAALLTPEKRAALQKELSDYNADLNQCQKALEEMQSRLPQIRPDRETLTAREQGIQEAEKQYLTRSTALTESLNREARVLKALRQLEEQYNKGYKQAEDDLTFARKLRGDASVGLQRYVLAAMFQSVLEEANRMLEKVHDGRYHLARVDEKGTGNKRGLELKVYDAYSAVNEPRSVALLSGGEKFLVSLALAIGLSAVAQHGGTRIDAMFIDEGFGTLDERSIEDAMAVLNCIRRGSGLVGIISHVDLLRRVIESKVEVTKSGQGSHIVVNSER